jgi:hypothetical protein
VKQFSTRRPVNVTIIPTMLRLTSFSLFSGLLFFAPNAAHAFATPTINTTQQPASATAGSSIADKAMVSGGSNPTGTVTFNLYNNPNGTGTPLFTDTETLSGGTATSAGYTTTGAGTVYWIATYNGDSNNSAVTSATASEPVVSIAPVPALSEWGLLLLAVSLGLLTARMLAPRRA